MSCVLFYCLSASTVVLDPDQLAFSRRPVVGPRPNAASWLSTDSTYQMSSDEAVRAAARISCESLTVPPMRPTATAIAQMSGAAH